MVSPAGSVGASALRAEVSAGDPHPSTRSACLGFRTVLLNIKTKTVTFRQPFLFWQGQKDLVSPAGSVGASALRAEVSAGDPHPSTRSACLGFRTVLLNIKTKTVTFRQPFLFWQGQKDLVSPAGSVGASALRAEVSAGDPHPSTRSACLGFRTVLLNIKTKTVTFRQPFLFWQGQKDLVSPAGSVGASALRAEVSAGDPHPSTRSACLGFRTVLLNIKTKTVTFRQPFLFWQGQKDLVSPAGSVGASALRAEVSAGDPHPSTRSACLGFRTVLLNIKTKTVTFRQPFLFWQGQKDLNPRHAVLETAALPTELYP